jgi:hypothetical protein
MDSLQSGKCHIHTGKISSTIWFIQLSTLFIFLFSLKPRRSRFFCSNTHISRSLDFEATPRTPLGSDDVQLRHNTIFWVHLLSPVMVFPRRSNVQVMVSTIFYDREYRRNLCSNIWHEFCRPLQHSRRQVGNKVLAWTQVAAKYIWNNSGFYALGLC